MFAAYLVLIFAFSTVHIAAEIPSYIHVCGLRNPQIEQCILNSINNLKNNICKGFPELDIPSFDPLFIDKLVFTNVHNLKLYLRNSQISGPCHFNITSFHADIDKFYYDMELTFDEIRINSTYDFDIHILVNIAHKGPLYITTDNVKAKVSLDFDLLTKDSKKMFYLADMKLNLDIKNYTAQYYIDEEHFGPLYEIIHNFLNQNQEEIIKSLKPAIEKVISDYIISLANKICLQFTYEELFPDRT